MRFSYLSKCSSTPNDVCRWVIISQSWAILTTGTTQAIQTDTSIRREVPSLLSTEALHQVDPPARKTWLRWWEKASHHIIRSVRVSTFSSSPRCFAEWEERETPPPLFDTTKRGSYMGALFFVCPWAEQYTRARLGLVWLKKTRARMTTHEFRRECEKAPETRNANMKRKAEKKKKEKRRKIPPK